MRPSTLEHMKHVFAARATRIRNQSHFLRCYTKAKRCANDAQSHSVHDDGVTQHFTATALQNTHVTISFHTFELISHSANAIQFTAYMQMGSHTIRQHQRVVHYVRDSDPHSLPTAIHMFCCAAKQCCKLCLMNPHALNSKVCCRSCPFVQSVTELFE